VADENPFFDDDTVGNEDVRLDLASRPYDCSTLYLDKGSNSRMVAYRSPIYINELRMIDPDSFTKSCRWMDRQRRRPILLDRACCGLISNCLTLAQHRVH
jgi:hypothetical protein